MKRSMVVLALMVALVFSGAASAWAGNGYSGGQSAGHGASATNGPMLPGGSWNCEGQPGDSAEIATCGPMLPGGSWDLEGQPGDSAVIATCGPMLPGGSWNME
ncbi:MAG: hypothetical protein ACOX4G_04120 [Limnochordia bacterium]|jgi:hypothetical protein